jgi:hypothetical protein
MVTTVEKSEMVTKAIGGIRVSRPLRRVLRPTVDQESRPARVSSSTRPSAANLQSAIASVLPLPEAPTIISQSGSSSRSRATATASTTANTIASTALSSR